MRRFGVVRALPMLGGLTFVELACTGCVVGAERPPTRLELARVPSEPGSRDAAASLSARRGCVSSSSQPAPPPLPPAAENAVWVEGYCHSTSVRYEWVPGHWETRAAPYSWK